MYINIIILFFFNLIFGYNHIYVNVYVCFIQNTTKIIIIIKCYWTCSHLKCLVWCGSIESYIHIYVVIFVLYFTHIFIWLLLYWSDHHGSLLIINNVCVDDSIIYIVYAPHISVYMLYKVEYQKNFDNF